MTPNRNEVAAVAIMSACLATIIVLPFVLESSNAGHVRPPAAAKPVQTSPEGDVESPDSSRKGEHGHDLDPAAPHWYLTVHGGDALADVFALDSTGRVIGGILGRVQPAEDQLRELRGITLLGDGRLAVVNAFEQNSRVLLFGPPSQTDMRPFQGVWVRQGPANTGFVHPYQIATSPDGTLYASNQDSNTVTRYRGLGSSDAGQPLPIPPALREFGTLPPGTIVPNSQHSPEGLREVRGIAWGPDGLLYVADRTAQEVFSVDPTNGKRVRVIMSAHQGLGHPIQLLFTPDRQSLLVGDNLNHCVWRVNMRTLAASHLVAPKSGGLNAPSALAIDGSHLLVGSRLGKCILKYRLSDGRFEGQFAKLQSNPEFLISTQQK